LNYLNQRFRRSLALK